MDCFSSVTGCVGVSECFFSIVLQHQLPVLLNTPHKVLQKTHHVHEVSVCVRTTYMYMYVATIELWLQTCSYCVGVSEVFFCCVTATASSSSQHTTQSTAENTSSTQGVFAYNHVPL